MKANDGVRTFPFMGAVRPRSERPGEHRDGEEHEHERAHERDPRRQGPRGWRCLRRDRRELFDRRKRRSGRRSDARHLRRGIRSLRPLHVDGARPRRREDGLVVPGRDTRVGAEARRAGHGPRREARRGHRDGERLRRNRRRHHQGAAGRDDRLLRRDARDDVVHGGAGLAGAGGGGRSSSASRSTRS